MAATHSNELSVTVVTRRLHQLWPRRACRGRVLSVRRFFANEQCNSRPKAIQWLLLDSCHIYFRSEHNCSVLRRQMKQSGLSQKAILRSLIGRLAALLSWHGVEYMFFRRARPVQPVIVYLLFAIALVTMPKADNPETLFDEANTPTNEMVIQKAVSSWEYGQSDAASETRILARSRRIIVRRIVPVCASQLTDSRRFRELFCFFRC